MENDELNDALLRLEEAIEGIRAGREYGVSWSIDCAIRHIEAFRARTQFYPTEPREQSEKIER